MTASVIFNAPLSWFGRLMENPGSCLIDEAAL
jgi:hypothetical protein